MYQELIEKKIFKDKNRLSRFIVIHKMSTKKSTALFLKKKCYS